MSVNLRRARPHILTRRKSCWALRMNQTVPISARVEALRDIVRMCVEQHALSAEFGGYVLLKDDASLAHACRHEVYTRTGRPFSVGVALEGLIKDFNADYYRSIESRWRETASGRRELQRQEATRIARQKAFELAPTMPEASMGIFWDALAVRVAPLVSHLSEYANKPPKADSVRRWFPGYTAVRDFIDTDDEDFDVIDRLVARVFELEDECEFPDWDFHSLCGQVEAYIEELNAEDAEVEKLVALAANISEPRLLIENRVLHHLAGRQSPNGEVGLD